MEKKLKDLYVLDAFNNRQVVLNYYNDVDFLVKRDGFSFQSLKLSDGTLTFTKKDETCFKVTIENYPDVYVDNQFPNFYVLRNNTDRLEIYFP
ncbi:MAG: hypothetical protein Q8935_07650 [Bacillota bacterium]|nr:hypothetical protein [Bacillota bacterium]MDP4155550.1 hypothetical protein [Bacillota bacterium]